MLNEDMHFLYMSMEVAATTAANPEHCLPRLPEQCIPPSAEVSIRQLDS